MKYLVFLLLPFLFVHCSSDDPTDPKDPMEDPGEDPMEEVIPTTFTQKILFEKISTEGCGICPGFTEFLLEYIDTIDHTLSLTITKDDNLAIPYGNNLYSYLAEPGAFLIFPVFSINRRTLEDDKIAYYDNPYTEWPELMNNAKAEHAEVGLAINTVLEGTTADIEVRMVGSVENASDLKLTVLLYEKDHPESTPGAQVNGNGTEDNPYLHDNLVVQVVSKDFNVLNKVGDNVAISPDMITTMSYPDVDVSAHNVDNIYVIAMLHYDRDPYKIFIENYQTVKIGENQEFD